ncbi:methyltransferase [Streptomyces sp. V2]|uniref:methyltransferase n=1 Tax=Streptomyces TaxID=1883 RepID=UPI000D670761|nr:methyltransferase [Streptomyces sp. V2]PWG11803.1 methyltransferase [Streptomyces sp. V2]
MSITNDWTGGLVAARGEGDASLFWERYLPGEVVFRPEEGTVVVAAEGVTVTVPVDAGVLSVRVGDVEGVRAEAEAAGVPVAGVGEGFRGVGPYGVAVEFREETDEALVARLLAKTDTVTPWAIRAAVTLRLPDLLAGEALSAARAAERVGADADALHRLLRLLSRHGVLAETPDGRFLGTALSEALREGHASGLVSSLDLGSAQARIDEVSRGILHSVRTGEPVYERLFGLPMWEDFAAEPALSESFQEWMSSKTRLLAPSLVEGYDWSGVRQVMDVGGGRGTLLAALLESVPALRGTLLELPGTAEEAVRELADSGAADRISVVGGSFFDALPTGADTVVLHNVLVNWDDEAATRILRRCAEAVGPGGRVLVLEGLPADETGETGEIGARDGGVLDDQRLLAQINLLMLMLFGGKERSLAEYGGLARTAGLAVTSASPTASGVWVVECRPTAA